MKSRLHVSHSSLGGHMGAVVTDKRGGLLAPSCLETLPSLTLGLEVGQILSESIQVPGQLGVW